MINGSLFQLFGGLGLATGVSLTVVVSLSLLLNPAMVQAAGVTITCGNSCQPETVSLPYSATWAPGQREQQQLTVVNNAVEPLSVGVFAPSAKGALADQMQVAILNGRKQVIWQGSLVQIATATHPALQIPKNDRRALYVRLELPKTVTNAAMGQTLTWQMQLRFSRQDGEVIGQSSAQPEDQSVVDSGMQKLSGIAGQIAQIAQISAQALFGWLSHPLAAYSILPEVLGVQADSRPISPTAVLSSTVCWQPQIGLSLWLVSLTVVTTLRAFRRRQFLILSTGIVGAIGLWQWQCLAWLPLSVVAWSMLMCAIPNLLFMHVFMALKRSSRKLQTSLE